MDELVQQCLENIANFRPSGGNIEFPTMPGLLMPRCLSLDLLNRVLQELILAGYLTEEKNGYHFNSDQFYRNHRSASV